MKVVGDPAYRMEVRLPVFDDFIFDESIKIGFKPFVNEGKIVFRMPRHMNIYFGVGAIRHKSSRTLKRPPVLLGSDHAVNGVATLKLTCD
jgi:hypothetical protein